MAIYKPRIFLTAGDKELLFLLAKLLTEAMEGRNSNIGQSRAPLTDEEAATLLLLLEKFVDSRKFIEGSYFVEGMLSGQLNDPAIRNIYLSWRKRLGRTRVMATVQWQNFTNRLGISSYSGGYLDGSFSIQGREMNLDHFMEMEKKLLRSSNLSPRVRLIIMEFVESKLGLLHELRRGERRLESRSIRRVPIEIAARLKGDRESRLGVTPLPASKLAGLMTIVLDFSTLFTTRDWSVTGTLSSAAGASIYAALD